MVEIGISDVRRINAIIREKYGLDFSNYAIGSFIRRISRIVETRNLSGVDEILVKMEGGIISKKEFLDLFTVNVTEMFRDPSFWRSLKPRLNELAVKDSLKIWHAGVSSGEEAYSTVICLAETGLLENTSIVGSDIDETILEKARSGIISNRQMEINSSNYKKFRENESADLTAYFEKRANEWKLSENLLSKIEFKSSDLTGAIEKEKFDVVLCRNVMIYFNQNLQRDVMKKLHASLRLSGLLGVGSKENISWTEEDSKFTCLNFEDKIYKKIKE